MRQKTTEPPPWNLISGLENIVEKNRDRTVVGKGSRVSPR